MNSPAAPKGEGDGARRSEFNNNSPIENIKKAVPTVLDILKGESGVLPVIVTKFGGPELDEIVGHDIDLTRELQVDVADMPGLGRLVALRVVRGPGGEDSVQAAQAFLKRPDGLEPVPETRHGGIADLEEAVAGIADHAELFGPEEAA